MLPPAALVRVALAAAAAATKVVLPTSCRRGEGEDEGGADDLLADFLALVAAVADGAAAGEDFLLSVLPVTLQPHERADGCQE